MHRVVLDGLVLFTNALLVVCLLSTTTVVERMWGVIRSIFLFAIFALVLWLPIFKGCTFAQIMRGAFGDLSITSCLVLLFWLFAKLCEYSSINPLNKGVAWIIFLLGCCLYASSLGFIGFDVYSYGYLLHSTIWIMCLYIIIQLTFWQVNKIFAFIWLIAGICFILKLQASINLWDYLFDPILWFISLCTVISRKKKNSSDIIFEYKV